MVFRSVREIMGKDNCARESKLPLREEILQNSALRNYIRQLPPTKTIDFSIKKSPNLKFFTWR